MAAIILFGLQAAAALADPGIPTDFDLRNLPEHEEEQLDITGSRHCRSEDGLEIVVCGRRTGEQRHRLRALPDAAYATEPVRAEMGVFGNSKVAVDVESATIGSGASAVQSKRAMVRLKTPF